MKVVRCQFLRESIPGPTGPFSNIAGRAQENAGAVIDDVSADLQKELDGMLHDVQQAFDRMKNRKENDTEQGVTFRKELHELVMEARRVLDGITQDSLDLCKQFK
jgi:hypothetical protein